MVIFGSTTVNATRVAVRGDPRLVPQVPPSNKSEPNLEELMDESYNAQIAALPSLDTSLRLAIAGRTAGLSLALVREFRGRGAEARDFLAPIYGWFTEGFDTRDLKEAKALLDELT
jgi:hypothetical protein